MVVAGFSLAACATVPPTRDVPAVLTSPTPKSQAELLRLVREALHGATVTLADDALTRESTLLIDRAPARAPDGTALTGRDTDRPHHFHLVKNGARCVLVQEGSGRRFALVDTTCAAK
jgi:hypothetical protein